MDAWIKIILALLNRGACWAGTTTTHTTRCTLY
jgi:hypothetical protein